jgi:hypothetical protein
VTAPDAAPVEAASVASIDLEAPEFDPFWDALAALLLAIWREHEAEQAAATEAAS